MQQRTKSATDGANGSARENSRRQQRNDLVDAGIDLLLTDGITALRGLLSVSAVHQRAEELGRMVPRASAYRSLQTKESPGASSATDELIRRVATEATDAERSGFARSQRAMIETFAFHLGTGDDDDPVAEQLISALQTNIESTLANDGLPITWLLQVTAMTASPSWRGTKRPTSANQRLAQDILDIFRAYADQVTAELAPLMQSAMSAARRRPRAGLTPETLIKLMNVMMDGALMHLMIEPNAFDTRLIAEAMYRIGVAFSEDGAHWDPRRGQGEEAIAFDKLVEAAHAQLQMHDDDGVTFTVAAVAAKAGVEPSLAAAIFPSHIELADSVVRCMVMSGGPPPDDIATANATQLASMLWQLADAADTHPCAIHMVREHEHQLTPSIIADLRSFARQLVLTSFPDGSPASESAGTTADTLLSVSLEGKESWRNVVPVLRLLGLPDGPAVAA